MPPDDPKEAEAKARLEVEAKAKVEAEAKVVAEAEVKAKALAAESPEAKAKVEADAKTKAEEEAKKTAQASDWRQKRINKLTAQKAELEAALVAKQRGGASPNPEDDVELARKVEELAEVKAQVKAVGLAEQREFDANCALAVEAGREAFGKDEFNGRIDNLKQLQDQGDSESIKQYVQLVAAMIETGEAPKLIYALGADLNEAARLMGLSPIKLGIALAKLAAKEPLDVSSAPKPIIPVGNKGGVHVAISPSDPTRADTLSTKAWMERRQADVDERAKLKYGR